MANTHLFQIFYSEDTRQRLDPGFTPLDNSKNERPDWREYWPIRNFLLSRSLVEGHYYGFFSPKFYTKTRLSAAAVAEFVEEHAAEADVLLFSPFFDQMAMYLNQWEQGATQHRSAARAFHASVALLAPPYQLQNLITTSRDSVFCNYFVATTAFWREWLRCCEKIFECAERGTTELAQILRGEAIHDWRSTPTKTFIIERVASLILATQAQWRVKAYDPMLLPRSPARISALDDEMAALDALKITYLAERKTPFLQAFLNLRQRFVLVSKRA